MVILGFGSQETETAIKIIRECARQGQRMIAAIIQAVLIISALYGLTALFFMG